MKAFNLNSFNSNSMLRHWFSNTRADVLSGMTVALALIPESIAFAVIAGVNPMVALYGSVCIAITIAFTGGRTGMISAATASTALLMISLVKQHGVEYLLAATVLAGLLQFALGALRAGRFITFVPQPVLTGFVNALGILIFLAQLPQIVGHNSAVYVIVIGTLIIVYTLPRLTRLIPSALVAIAVMTIIAVAMGLDVPRVVDMGPITSLPPLFHAPVVPLSFTTLAIIFPYALGIALVGILESLLTATVIDEITETKSPKNREIRGQGLANIVAGFFGGMAGCAMIGQSGINMRSGGRNRLSTLVAGLFLLALIAVMSPILKSIPMATLVGVMVSVAVGTFDWGSLRELAKMPRPDAVVMVVTVIVVVATKNLAVGVLAGVVLSALAFGWKIAQIRTTAQLDAAGEKVYTLHGQLFFGTMTHFVDQFDPSGDPQQVAIDFRHSHVWDHSAIAAIEKVVGQYERQGKAVRLVGLNAESEGLIAKVGRAALLGESKAAV